MANYARCPNCGSTETGVAAYRCNNCLKLFCRDCARGGSVMKFMNIISCPFCDETNTEKV